jgi:hypothetical protein
MRGRAIISQKMASTEAKAGKPKANHLRKTVIFGRQWPTHA